MTSPNLELHDIQSGALRPRPTPFHATYIVVRIDDRDAGRELMRRLSEVVSSAARPEGRPEDTWVSASLTFAGLKALGVPQVSLESFSPQFQQGMAARAHMLGDIGESAPAHWEKPLGSNDVHVVITAISKDMPHLEAALGRAKAALAGLKISAIWRQDCHVLPDETEPFGFKDGISHPAIEGSGISGTNPHEVPLRAGEFVLGYPDEMGETPLIPRPDVLGRNGSYVAFRKLHQRVAEFRRYLRANASSPQDEGLLAAKMMGRWRSGTPLALSAVSDAPAIGADPKRNNDFLFQADDPIGYKTPLGSHIRRMNPRDAQVAGVPRIHRMIRRGTAYGPPLPPGVLEDDGAERGLMFAFVGAHLGRQFEFVQSEWTNTGTFFGGAAERDPVSGAGDGTGTFSIPRRPIRRQLVGLPRFVVTRGGEYCFMPSLSALRWLSELPT
ncbi:MAG TPA: Dyp-type peroxidase [Candidatus Cybelea sp.]|nr:Dyp-type peroxidase [Candidatus Cybelea sp.]